MDNKQIDALIALLEGVQRGEQPQTHLVLPDGGSGDYSDTDLDHILLMATRSPHHLFAFRTVPQPKVIDLSCLVGSDVLCEFWDKGQEDRANKAIGYLVKEDEKRYVIHTLNRYDYCRPATMVQACKSFAFSKLKGVDWSWSKAEIDGEKLFVIKIFGTLEGYIWPHEKN